MNLFWCKVNVKLFGFNNLHQDFDIMRIVHTVIDACRYKRSKDIHNENLNIDILLRFNKVLEHELCAGTKESIITILFIKRKTIFHFKQLNYSKFFKYLPSIILFTCVKLKKHLNLKILNQYNE